MHTESSRKLLHIGLSVFALLIGRIPPWAISLSALAALVFNLTLLARVTRRSLERPQERALGWPPGLWMYPFGLLLVSLCWHQEQVFMAVAWGQLAFGDAAAGWAGARFGGPPLPWNRQKTWTGWISGILAGWLGSWALVALLPEAVRLEISLLQWALLLGPVSLAAAWAETLPDTLDDNLAVPLAAAGSAWAAVRLSASGQAFLPADLWLALPAAALPLWWIHRRDAAPVLILSLCGALLAFLGGSWALMAAMLAWIVFAAWASPVFRHPPADWLSLSAVPAACAGLAWLLPADQPRLALMAAAAIGAGWADLAASAAGLRWGSRCWTLPVLRPAVRGASGAVSLEGSLAGAGICAVIGVWAAWIVPDMPAQGWVCAAAAVAGLACDSILGAGPVQQGRMSGSMANIASAAAAAAAAHLLLELAA
jgi:dolichol kinase